MDGAGVVRCEDVFGEEAAFEDGAEEVAVPPVSTHDDEAVPAARGAEAVLDQPHPRGAFARPRVALTLLCAAAALPFAAVTLPRVAAPRLLAALTLLCDAAALPFAALTLPRVAAPRLLAALTLLCAAAALPFAAVTLPRVAACRTSGPRGAMRRRRR